MRRLSIRVARLGRPPSGFFLQPHGSKRPCVLPINKICIFCRASSHRASSFESTKREAAANKHAAIDHLNILSFTFGVSPWVSR